MKPLVACLVVALLVLAVPATAAVPQIQSHRGGAERDGKPAFAEESMAAFRSAWGDERTVLELDVKLSADRVPVVIHDATLDRTTVCTGRVDARTWADLRKHCPSDVLGIDPLPRAKADPPVPMASLREVLDYARASGAPLNIEIKNIPGEPDFDPSPGYADTVLATIKASRVPLSLVIIQSFYPPNLDEAQRVFPGVATAFLTASGASSAPALFAAVRGYTWWSPAWPVSKADVDQAHSLGLKVVPWTIDTPDGIRGAAAARVDALITNDPVMATRALAGGAQQAHRMRLFGTGTHSVYAFGPRQDLLGRPVAELPVCTPRCGREALRTGGTALAHLALPPFG